MMFWPVRWCALVIAVALPLMDSRAAHANSCVPGFDFAMFTEGTSHWQGNASTDSWDSSSGTYADTKTCSSGDVGTNSTAAGAFNHQGASTVICGDVGVGPGGDPSTVSTGNGTVTGNEYAMSEAVALDDVTAPVLPLGAPFAPSYTNQAAALAPNYEYGAVSCKNGSLALNAGTYVVKNLSLQANCRLTVASGPISFYFTEHLELQGGAVVNNTGLPSNLVFYGTASATAVQVQGGAGAYFAVYAPRASCEIQGNADIWGAMVCASASVQGNAHVHYDRALSDFAGGGFACPLATITEVSRSNPIVADLSGSGEFQYQGSFERPVPEPAPSTFDGGPNFEFPHVLGHLRAIDASSISDTQTEFNGNALTVQFDAGDPASTACGGSPCIPPPELAGCAPAFSSSCRTVFTHTATSGTPLIDKVFLTTAPADHAALKPLLDPDGAFTDAQLDLLIARILAGRRNGAIYEPRLGGIDRSTMAIIRPSALAGSSSRPAMIYVGALDGMLHAICAEAVAGSACDAGGQELWAFIPRTQLARLRQNAGRIDGSPTVADVFGDFDRDGRSEFHTVLTFQTGSGTAGDASAPPAVYALDVTDPEAPEILWEATTPGVGIDTAMGVSPGGKHLTFIQASSGNSLNAGAFIAALETGNQGAVRWSWTYAYPAPRAANPAIPTTAIPAGVAVVDRGGQGLISHVVVPSLYGEVFILNADDGTNDYGPARPAVRFSSDFHPVGVTPTIYADPSTGGLHALVVTGGYVDTDAASLWAPPAVTQFALSFSLDIPATSAPITEASPLIDFKIDFGAGERAFASAVIAGNELLIVTDSQNVNAGNYGLLGSSGTFARYSLSGGAQLTPSVAVAGGAGSVGASILAGVAFVGSGAATQRVDLADFAGGGAAVDLAASQPRTIRLLWMEF